MPLLIVWQIIMVEVLINQLGLKKNGTHLVMLKDKIYFKNSATCPPKIKRLHGYFMYNLVLLTRSASQKKYADSIKAHIGFV